jgi:isopenicillin N synthase-like dioxygenase
LTVLHREEEPLALQIRDRSGAWVEVPSVPDSFVVNIGDMMAVWTNDRWVSSRHRVAAPGVQQEPRSRYAFPFFCLPNWNTSLTAIPTCISPTDPPRHPPIAVGEYLLQRSRASKQELLYGKKTY